MAKVKCAAQQFLKVANQQCTSLASKRTSEWNYILSETTEYFCIKLPAMIKYMIFGGK